MEIIRANKAATKATKGIKKTTKFQSIIMMNIIHQVWYYPKNYEKKKEDPAFAESYGGQEKNISRLCRHYPH